jgi:hypothetical protein
MAEGIWKGFSVKIALAASGIAMSAVLAYAIWLGTTVVQIKFQITQLNENVASLLASRSEVASEKSDLNTQRITNLESRNKSAAKRGAQ